MHAIHLEPTQLSPGLELALSDRQAIFRHELTEEGYRDKVLSGVKGHITQAQSAPIAPAEQVPDTSSSAKPIVIGFGLVALAIFAAALLLYNRLAPESSLVPGIAQVEPSPVADITTQPVTRQPSIAVLPFDNLSPLAENAYFAAGIHEDVLSALSKVQALKVISRTSVMRFADTNKSLPDIARELGAAHILEGSVRRSGNQVRITVQLIDASTDEHLWAETYDRQLEDIFAIQSEVAKNITEALKVALDVGTIVELERMPTDNFEAYDLYMKGRALLNTRSSGGIQDALRMFEEAIVREPEFALAHASKAEALVSVAFSSGDWASVRESGFTAAETAIQFDPDSAYTNITMARVYQMDSNLAETTAYVDKVLELHPNYAMAFRMKGDLEYMLGHNEAAYNNWKKFVEMDPLNPMNNMAMALVLTGMERFTESDSYVTRLLELEPTANNYGWAGLFYFVLTKPDRFKSLKHLREGHRLDPGSIDSILVIATVLQFLGDNAAAMQWLALAQQIAPHNETLYARRLDSLAYARKQDQFDQLLSDWYSYDPNSILYHRYASTSLSRKAFDLSAQERFDDAIAVWQEAITHSQIFAKASTVDGEIRVTVDNVWGILGYMTNARALGQDDLATMLAQKVIKLYEDTPAYYYGPFHLTVAYAALGDNDKALHNFQQVPGSALSSIPLVELFRLNDPEGPYSGISSDIAFKQTLEKIRIENEAILRRVAKEMPDLLDPASRL